MGYDHKIIELQFQMMIKTIMKFFAPKVLSTKRFQYLDYQKNLWIALITLVRYLFAPKHISALPNLGEVDIFRSLQFLPGVQLGSGETSELYIRGGSPDQNLMLLDWMPIYQTGHMFGFISGISANSVKDVQVYKVSIPPKYGGRISSVIDISSKTGNINNIVGNIWESNESGDSN